MTISRLQKTATHGPTALSRGERVSGSGGFISRSVTGEGSVHSELTTLWRDRPTGQAYFSAAVICRGPVGYGESMATLTRVSSTKPVGVRSQPLTRPATADESAVSIHPLPWERALLPVGFWQEKAVAAAAALQN
jgi:hypothetical protein